MNSYPIELLAQHAPLMFVAGLDPPSVEPTTSVSPPPPIKLADTTANHLNVPGQRQKDATHDPFGPLISRLREALTSRPKNVVWEPTRGKNFYCLLVDKAVRFPPRKMLPPGEYQASAVPHSPLSPLTPSSPLYPDGLIAPIWLRKHIELVPAVFVLFLRIWESPPPVSPLDPRDTHDKDEERRRDMELAGEISMRKKATTDRNIKLTVVLLASRRTLDDPALDSRLTFVRRQSGLDSRAALFVLSPVSQSELGEFVRSLQDALHEPAMDYYTSQSKRVRRKRNKHNPNSAYAPTVLPSSPGATSTGRPLRSAGWMVRYEYKMATFAEFRSEEEVARKHYEDCWAGLVEMFSSTAILPPRTKRWAEAKVLADCITIKICKMYLYHNETSLALGHFNRHLAKFSELSRGWGIGEETFEFWSWMARQYRILGELLELGLRSSLKLPSLLPSPIHSPAIHPVVPGQLPVDPMMHARALGLNPSTALQHPGYYYYTAAQFSKARHDRFVKAEKNELSPQSAPGFANEKKVDHQTLILELYTKAYELFKKHGSGQNRLTLFIALRIAETYHSSGKYDAAVRFFERIARTYRKEKWGLLLRPMLNLWLQCARHLQEPEMTIRILTELLAPAADDSGDALVSSAIEEELVATMKTASPKTDTPLVVELPEGEQIFVFSVVFWKTQVAINEPAPFQLSITTPAGTSISSLPFESLAIHFSDERPPVIIRHAPEKASEDSLQVVRLGDIHDEMAEHEARLRWQTGITLVVEGWLTSAISQDLRISKVVLNIAEGEWKIQLPFDPASSRIAEAITLPRWLVNLPPEPPKYVPLIGDQVWLLHVRPKPHQLSILIKHQAPAYLNEEYPVVIEVASEDDRQLDIMIDILLHPAEDDSDNHILIDERRSTSMIKGVRAGSVHQGEVLSSKLYLHSVGGNGGQRILDISIQSRAVSPTTPSTPSDHESDLEPPDLDVNSDFKEYLQTIVIPVVAPFEVVSQTLYHRITEPLRPMLDLDAFDGGDFQSDVQATVTTKVVTNGPWDLEVQSVKVSRRDVPRAKLLHCSIPEGDQDVSIWQRGDVYLAASRVDLSLGESEEVDEEPVQPPAAFEIVWKRFGDQGKTTTSVIPLPIFRPPRDGIVVLVDPPPTARMHVPFPLRLTVQNRHLHHTVDLVLQIDPSEGFVVSGLKVGRLPVLLPNTSEELLFNLIPLTCGTVKLPTFHIRRSRRKQKPAENGRENTLEDDSVAFEVVDLRWDARDEEGRVHAYFIQDPDDETILREVGRDDTITMLVLP